VASLGPHTFLERERRHQINIDAWIRQKGSFATQQCHVIDISRNGVRLEVVDPYKILDTFLLLFSRNDAGQHATVRWRRGTQLGAKFLSANPTPSGT
jgi:PilZ domain-containing protein